MIRVTLEGDELRLRKVEVKDASTGSLWLKELYDLYVLLNLGRGRAIMFPKLGAKHRGRCFTSRDTEIRRSIPAGRG